MQVLKYILCFCLTTFMGFTTSKAQLYNANLEFFSYQKILRGLQFGNSKVYSSFKPITLDNKKLLNYYKSDNYNSENKSKYSDKFKSSWIYRKLRTENFIEYKSDKFSIFVNPLLYFEYTKGKNHTETFFINQRGIEIKGSIGKKLSYYSAFYENQARFMPHVAKFVKKSLVAPGQGAVKILKNNKYDFSSAQAYLNILFSDNIGLQFGHGKHFIGEGYRSLLLSDNSFSYPYLRLDLSYKNFKYTLLWAQYQLFKTAYYNYHTRKYSSISYLSWLPKQGIELSLFESVMWPGNTTVDRYKFNVNYFNPIILSRSAIYGLNNEKNILLGLNARIKLYKFAQIFAQFALDNLDSKVKANNNYAFQIGVKHFDLLHNKLSNTSLFIHTEFNYIAPYTYSWINAQQAYTHYNQSLTHPAGSGLYEFVAIASLNYRDFAIKAKYSFLKNNIDQQNSNYGSDVFLPNILDENIISHTSNKIGQGVERTIHNANVEFSYTINPVSQLQIFTALDMHSSLSVLYPINREVFFSFGLKTNINNYYYN